MPLVLSPAVVERSFTFRHVFESLLKIKISTRPPTGDVGLATSVEEMNTTPMPTVVFLHGLNTFGADDLRIGPLNFGLMHTRIDSEFRKLSRGLALRLVSVTGCGCGPAEEQAERASEFLEAAGISGDLVLFGHSVGGLVARALAARPEMEGRVRKIITVGTPHRGAMVADLGLSFATRHPFLYRILKFGGYDTLEKTKTIAQFTLASLEAFNARTPSTPNVEEIALICEARWSELSWPYFFGYLHLHPRGSDRVFPASDGFIYSESQKRGRLMGPFALDHYGQMGFFFQLNPFARKKAKSEFHRLIATVVELAATSR
jgi:pimeloyl-ACP methyl ester carboxylesterase